ncbi:MAG: LysR family transcriptional regulator [Mycobacteriales bacterium]|nr:LysR family transcriptional regulator [Mycobacteriales bacterium]
MRLRQVEAFLAVVNGLHYGKAARQLYVSTSTVSRLVNQLERELGAPLLDRTRGEVRLTPLGQELIEPAGRVLAAVAAFDSAACAAVAASAPRCE